jgi:hypothetical protein
MVGSLHTKVGAHDACGLAMAQRDGNAVGVFGDNQQ